MNKSVTRRVIAITYSICCAGVLTYLSVAGVESALISLTGMAGMVLGFYFGVKSGVI